MKFRFVLMGPEEDPEGEGRPCGDRTEISISRPAPLYEQSGSEMIRRERLPTGRWKITTLANFQARIVRDLILEESAGESRHCEVEAEVGGRRVQFSMPAAEFARMSWVAEKLGSEAIVYPGQQQHARAAIQWLSGAVPQQRIFTHLGWRQWGSQWVYLHAGGAIGSDGPVAGLRVQLPAALQGYQLRAARDGDALKCAVRASLGCLEVAPDRISLPLLAAVYRAPFGKVDFSVFVVGATGRFKTALAALCQQHFGASMDAGSLPGNFASTAYGLEGLAFHAKDALLVVDDFAPRRMGGDGVLQGLAERLFRAAGNQQGRSRMGGGGRLAAPQPPRGLLLATGEEVPQGASIRARLVTLEVAAGAVDRGRLGDCQRAGRAGQLAEAMGGFVAWMGGRYEELQGRLRERAQEMRSALATSGVHARIPGALAELQAGWEMFLQYGEAVGALGSQEAEELAGRAARVWGELGRLQGPYQEDRDVAERFLARLREALVAGQAHVASRHGGVPEDASRWGWQQRVPGRGWRPLGRRIGWVEGRELFLDPSASYEVAEAMAGREKLGVSEQTLRQRLRASGLLVSTDASRHMLAVRRMVEGRSRAVLHLPARKLGTDAQTGSPNAVW